MKLIETWCSRGAWVCCSPGCEKAFEVGVSGDSCEEDKARARMVSCAPEALRMLRKVMFVGIPAEMTEEIERILTKAGVAY